jgi:hypothetical protein
MIVIMVLRLVLQHIDIRKPLDHPSTNVSRNDETDRISVIRLKYLSVGFVGDENVIGGVHGTCERDGSTVFDEFAPWFILEWTGAYLVGEVFGSDEFNVFARHVLSFVEESVMM